MLTYAEAKEAYRAAVSAESAARSARFHAANNWTRAEIGREGYEAAKNAYKAAIDSEKAARFALDAARRNFKR